MKGNEVKIMSKKRSKSEKKILTVPMIKNAIRSGHTYCNDLAKLFRIKKQNMHYYLKKLERGGIIKIDIKEGNGKVAVYYKVVEPMVKQSTMQDWTGQKTYFEDEAYASYGIIEYDEHLIPDNDWHFGKTLMKGIHINDVFIRISNDKTITFIFPKIYGDTPQQAHYNLIVKAVETKNEFLKKNPNFKLSNYPINDGFGSIGTTSLKTIVNNLNPHLPIKTDEWTIDSTPERGSLEVKVKNNPLEASEKLQKTVDTILNYPNEINEIRAALKDMTVAIKSLVDLEMERSGGSVVEAVKEYKKLKEETATKSKKKQESPSYVG